MGHPGGEVSNATTTWQHRQAPRTPRPKHQGQGQGQGQGQQRVSLASGLLRRAPRSIPRAQGAARLARKVS